MADEPVAPHRKTPAHSVLRLGRRIVIAVIGGVVVLSGVVLSLPLVPGPGVALILLGLAILALEFERPRHWLAELKARGTDLRQSLKERGAGPWRRLKMRLRGRRGD